MTESKLMLPRCSSFFVANPLSLISKVFRNIPFRTEDRVMMHQKCASNTSFVMPGRKKIGETDHPLYFMMIPNDTQPTAKIPATKPTIPPAPENSRLSWVVTGNAKGQGSGCFYEGVHEFGKPLQCCFCFLKKTRAPFLMKGFFI